MILLDGVMLYLIRFNLNKTKKRRRRRGKRSHAAAPPDGTT